MLPVHNLFSNKANFFESGRRVSNSRPIAWKAIALPIELLPLFSLLLNLPIKFLDYYQIEINLELLMRIELTTSSLPRKCSTPELQQLEGSQTHKLFSEPFS